MISRFSRFVFLCMCVLPLAAQTANEVEITAEPSHHQVFKNEYVRVFKVEVAPHAATLMHWHRHDYIVIALGDAKISDEVEGKTPDEVTLTDGETVFVDGNVAHRVKDLSAQPFRNVTIELLRDEEAKQETSPWPEETGERDFPGGRATILFIKDGARCAEAELEAGASVPTHRHNGPHLMVAINAVHMLSEVQGEAPAEWKLQPGDMEWLPTGYTHSMKNVGSTTAKFVTLEF